MQIPKIIHQLWKSDRIPSRWRRASESVRRYHKDWQYRLWTDDMMDHHVKTLHPDFYPVFAGMNRHIMRVDVFRYVLMYDYGGLYCDLDYEFLRPYDYGESEVVLSLEYDMEYGDDRNEIANYVFASVPRHKLWEDILEDLKAAPPDAPAVPDVAAATGPKFVTRIYNRNRERYQGVRLTQQPTLSPRRVHGRYERKYYINSGQTYGFHYGWGSWRERGSLPYFRLKFAKWASKAEFYRWSRRTS